MISNLMESAVGRAAVAHLAAAWPSLAGPHGLATGVWFERDVAPEADRISAGFLRLRPGPGLGFEPVLD
jgi:L-alanine-DL-glutamate epimerase-like enolase superfamily enzyme